MAKKKYKIPEPNKANVTSYKVGDKAAETWTLEVAESFMLQALELSKNDITLTNIANKLDVYTHVFDYVCEKYPNFTSIKKQIMKNLENNIFTGAISKDGYTPSVAIFGLKHNYGWRESSNIDVTTNGESINKPPIKFIE